MPTNQNPRRSPQLRLRRQHPRRRLPRRAEPRLPLHRAELRLLHRAGQLHRLLRAVVRLPGAVKLGVVLSLVGVVKLVAVVMEHTSKEGDPKFKAKCELPLTGTNVVDMVITELGVFSRPTRKDLFKLIELAPGVTREEIRRKTLANYLD